MRSPTVTGLDVPGPGSRVFQTMFSLSDHCTGSLSSLLVPSPHRTTELLPLRPNSGGDHQRDEQTTRYSRIPSHHESSWYQYQIGSQAKRLLRGWPVLAGREIIGDHLVVRSHHAVISPRPHRRR